MKLNQGKMNVVPNALLDAVAAHLGLTNDRMLAHALRVQPSAISKIRNITKKKISAQMILSVHKLTGWPIDRIEVLAATKADAQ